MQPRRADATDDFQVDDASSIWSSCHPGRRQASLYWSGAGPMPAATIFPVEVCNGPVTRLESSRHRAEVVDRVMDLAADPPDLIVGPERSPRDGERLRVILEEAPPRTRVPAPRLLTGAVTKSSQRARAAHLERGFPRDPRGPPRRRGILNTYRMPSRSTPPSISPRAAP
jgi:hypothetical protein